jgi:hypothetical protein
MADPTTFTDRDPDDVDRFRRGFREAIRGMKKCGSVASAWGSGGEQIAAIFDLFSELEEETGVSPSMAASHRRRCECDSCED